MTIEELLKACAKGEMPKVQLGETPQYAESNIGQVVVIKNGTKVFNHSGCGVKFPGLGYDLWFNAESGTDKRKRYMKDLKLV